MAAVLILLLLLGLFLLQAALYDRLWNKGLKVEVNFREEYAAEDETAVLEEVVVNGKFLPLPAVEVSFHMDRGLRFTDEANTAVSDRSYRRDVFALGVRQKITRTLEFQCVKRGYYRIDEAGLNVRSLMLTRKYLTDLPQNTEFYVLPRPVPADRIAIPFSQIMGTVLSRRKVYDDPFEFAGLRDYARGDPRKDINWKATARTGDLLVNMHESTLSQKVAVLLDLEGLGVQQADVLNEEAVRIASSLCARLLAAGVEVDVYSNGTDALTGTPLRAAGVSGAGSVLSLRKKFACVRAGNGLLPIGSFFPAGREAHNALFVLVSRNQTEELSRELSLLAGKETCVQIVPYREEHTRAAAPGNVRRSFWEV